MYVLKVTTNESGIFNLDLFIELRMKRNIFSPTLIDCSQVNISHIVTIFFVPFKTMSNFKPNPLEKKKFSKSSSSFNEIQISFVDVYRVT